jgi:hypothetical protein
VTVSPHLFRILSAVQQLRRPTLAVVVRAVVANDSTWRIVSTQLESKICDECFVR